MYAKSLQPPDPKPCIGPGIRAIHAAIMEQNICDLAWTLKKYGDQARNEADGDAALEDAIETFLSFIPMLRELGKQTAEAWTVLDRCVYGREE